MMKFDYDDSLTRQDALSGLIDNWKCTPQTHEMLLENAFGRVLAQDTYAQYSLPVVRSSKRDGIAVRSSDFKDGMPDTSKWRRGRDFISADTGDDFSDEFDAVITIEEVSFDEAGRLTIHKQPHEIVAGFGVNSSGSLVEKSSPIVEKNTKLTPELISALAIGGYKKVEVYKKPVVAFIPTGSELVAYGTPPERGQNIDSNSLLVKGFLEEVGAQVECFPIIKDDKNRLEEMLKKALAFSDIVLINGGSSRGEEDFNSLLIKQHASYFKHGVRAVPGRPIGMAIIEGKPVINIPGPAAAASLALSWLVNGLVFHYYGLNVPKPHIVEAYLEEDIGKPVLFERLCRVSLKQDDTGRYFCCPLSSPLGVPQIIEKTQGMLVLPIGSEGAKKGEQVSVVVLRPLSGISKMSY